MSRFAAVAAAFAIVAQLLVAAGPGPALAGVAAPTIISPLGDAASAEPRLRWMRIAEADSYRVQISSSDTFATLAYDVVTTNSSATPQVDLEPGLYHWRVSVSAPTPAGPWAAATFTKTASLGTPTQLTPADGATIDGPDEAPILAWTAVTGASAYEVELSESPAMTDPFYAERGTTSLVVDFATLGVPLHWRVRALGRNGTTAGSWSGIRSFETSFDGAPGGLTPANGASVRDINLAWNPMPGVPRYVLQITPGPALDWDSPDTQQLVTTMTRYQFEDPNAEIPATWVWRVRARDADGNDGPWSAERVVTRVLSNAPTLTAPAVGATVGEGPTLSWTPVIRAGFYQVDVSLDPSFADGVATYHTTETTFDLPSSELSPFVLKKGETYFWRVRGIDNPPEQLFAMTRPASPWSSSRTFDYEPAISTLVSPANGATISVPTLTWDPVNALIHRVTIENDDGDIVDRAMTYAHSYTPAVALDPSDGPFSWYVERVAQPGDGAAEVAWKTPERTFNLVAVTPSAVTPTPLLPTGTHSLVSPSLSWTPVVGADHYNIFRFSDFPPGTLPEDEPDAWNEAPLHYPAFTYALGNLDVRSYLYLVRAYDADGDLIAHGPSATFVIDALPAPQLVSPDDCVADGCPVHADTPRVSWEAVPGAIRYTVQFDSGATWQAGALTHNTSVQLPGDPAFPIGGGPRTWVVYACVEQRCSQAASASLLLELPAVEHDTPADDAVVDGPQVTVSWNDLIESSAAAGTTGTPRSEANFYAVAISSPDGPAGGLVDGLETTQLLASGVHQWSILGHTGGGAVTPETVRTLTVVHEGPDLVAPANGSSEARTPTLAWAASTYTAAYELEVFRGASTVLANRVVHATTTTPGFTPNDELGPGTYTWRVRSELTGARSDWSATRTFTIAAVTAPALSEPATGHRTASGILLFVWGATPGAVAYRFESSSSPSFTTTRESVVTGQRLWAPVAAYPRGTWHWRVIALGATNAVLATSAVRTVHSDVPTSPSAQIAGAGTTLPTSGSTPFGVSWSGSLAPGVSVTYQLARSTDGGAFTTIASQSTTASSWVLSPGHRYRFRVRTIDSAGDKSPWATATAFDVSINNENSSAIAYKGAWSIAESSAYVAGRERYSRAEGAKATFSFMGSQVAWVAAIGPSRGRARVYVDGVLIQTVNLNAASTLTRRIVFTRSWSSAGAHKVKVVVLGTAGHPRVDVDAFITKR